MSAQKKFFKFLSMNSLTDEPPLKKRKIENKIVKKTNINYVCYICFVAFYCWEDCLSHCLVFQHHDSPGVLVDIHATTPAERFSTLHQLCAVPLSDTTEK